MMMTMKKKKTTTMAEKGMTISIKSKKVDDSSITPSKAQLFSRLFG
jgi:hypothetical protein